MSIDALHRASGSVDVATDLLRRSGAVYLGAETATDPRVASCFMDASEALAVLADALRRELRERSGGKRHRHAL